MGDQAVEHPPISIPGLDIQTKPINNQNNRRPHGFVNQPDSSDSEEVVGEERDNTNQLLGGFCGRFGHEIAKRIARFFTNRPEYHDTEAQHDYRVSKHMRSAKFDHFPDLPNKSNDEKKLVQGHVREAYTKLYRQLETLFKDPNAIYFSEWKQKPSSRAVAEFGCWWRNDENQRRTAALFDIEPDQLPGLTYDLLRNWSRISAEVATSHNGGAASESARLIVRLLHNASNNLDSMGSTAIRPTKSQSEMHHIDYDPALQFLDLCHDANLEINQYVGGNSSALDRVFAGGAKDKLSSSITSEMPRLTTEQIRQQLEKAIELFTPDEDIDLDAVANQIQLEADDPEQRSRREKLLAPPWVVPDLLKIDLSDVGEHGLQAGAELRRYMQQEQQRTYPGKREKIAHPNFFQNPEVFGLIDQIVKDGGRVSIIDIKNHLYKPGSPKPYKEKMGFQVMAFAQWVIAMRRQEQSNYTIFNLLDDPIVQNYTGVNIMHLNLHLNEDDLTAEPKAEPDITWDSLWQETIELRDKLPETPSDQKRRELLKQLFEPYLQISRKCATLLDAKRRTVSS